MKNWCKLVKDVKAKRRKTNGYKTRPWHDWF